MNSGNGEFSAFACERLLDGASSHLSNLELLAALVGEGASLRLLSRFKTLTELDQASPLELTETCLTEDYVVRLLAARELAKRRAAEKTVRGAPALDSRSVVELVEPFLQGEVREIVMVLALDTKRRLVCSPITVAIGTVDSVPLHPREVFRPLIRVAAYAAILVHLHPSSGEPIPSPDDVLLTSRIMEAGELLGIPLLDHVVIGKGRKYVSFFERGLL